MKTHTFHVSGTHCPSCKIYIEDVLGEENFVESAKVDLKKETVEISVEDDRESSELAQVLTEKIKFNGYVLSVEKGEVLKNSNGILWQAIPLGLLILVVFFLIQKSGILNFGIGGKITPITSFMVGLVASVSSCLAIVGGLILSLSAKISEDNISDTKTITLFHVGRIVSFALLGGVLGALGGIIGISFTFSSILGLIAALVMIFLGVNLTGIWKKKGGLLSSSAFKFFRKIEHKTFAPLILGFATFFLPCGFTQAMQIQALGSGSFFTGLMIMFAFSLGTLPMLLFLSFGSASFAHSKHAPLFFKTVGVVVLGLGLFAFLAGLAGVGIINPIFNI